MILKNGSSSEINNSEKLDSASDFDIEETLNKHVSTNENVEQEFQEFINYIKKNKNLVPLENVLLRLRDAYKHSFQNEKRLIEKYIYIHIPLTIIRFKTFNLRIRFLYANC